MNEPKRFDTPVITSEIQLEGILSGNETKVAPAVFADLFTRVADFAFDILDCGEDYILAKGCEVRLVEAHSTFLRGLNPSASVRGTFRLLDQDRSGLVSYLEIYHSEGWLASAMHARFAHVDAVTGKALDFPEELSRDISTMLRYHRSLPRPKYLAAQITSPAAK